MTRKNEENPTNYFVCSKEQNIISPSTFYFSFVCFFFFFFSLMLYSFHILFYFILFHFLKLYIYGFSFFLKDNKSNSHLIIIIINTF